jgi:hypothetical protein
LPDESYHYGYGGFDGQTCHGYENCSSTVEVDMADSTRWGHRSSIVEVELHMGTLERHSSCTSDDAEDYKTVVAVVVDSIYNSHNWSAVGEKTMLHQL